MAVDGEPPSQATLPLKPARRKGFVEHGQRPDPGNTFTPCQSRRRRQTSPAARVEQPIPRERRLCRDYLTVSSVAYSPSTSTPSHTAAVSANSVQLAGASSGSGSVVSGI